MGQSDGRIIEIVQGQESFIEDFLRIAGRDTLSKFRYFNKRPLTVIGNHLLTLIYLEQGSPVGYGHLDNEDDKVWLGISVAHHYQGLGIGKRIMNKLIEYAHKNKIPKISLSVDKQNIRAFELYTRLGFCLTQEKMNTIYMEKDIAL